MRYSHLRPAAAGRSCRSAATTSKTASQTRQTWSEERWSPSGTGHCAVLWAAPVAQPVRRRTTMRFTGSASAVAESRAIAAAGRSVMGEEQGKAWGAPLRGQQMARIRVVPEVRVNISCFETRFPSHYLGPRLSDSRANGLAASGAMGADLEPSSVVPRRQ